MIIYVVNGCNVAFKSLKEVQKYMQYCCEHKDKEYVDKMFSKGVSMVRATTFRKWLKRNKKWNKWYDEADKGEK